MNPIKTAYDHLPGEVRVKIRSILPGRFLRWYAHRHADAFIVSYPKCGRTWLRLMVGKAIAHHFELEEEEDILFLRWKKKPHPDVPMITVVHDDRPMLKAPHELETSKKKYKDKDVIFLVRDPRDVIVSSFFEMSKRGRIFGDNPYENRQPVFDGSLEEFIQRQEGGFDTILEYFNIWANNRHIPRGFLLVRYEDIKADPKRELRRVLTFLGMPDISDQTIEQAVEYASFENMRKMEANGKFQTAILNPANIADQDSYKARKGKVHGYADYLNINEILVLDQKIQTKLSDYFGYRETGVQLIGKDNH